jgi:hypothetical protein
VSVAVLVPFDTSDPQRAQVWAYLLERWQVAHRDWPVFTGRDRTEGGWRKAEAIKDALSQTDADILIVADADIWCDRVADAVVAVQQGQAKWAVPQLAVHRLSEKTTADLLNGTRVLERPGNALEVHVATQGGGLTVLTREVLEGVPIDPAFSGWGQEDESWALALNTLAGPAWRGNTWLTHLWHQPQERLSREIGSDAGRARYRQYQQAAGNQPAMRALISEFCPTPLEGYVMTSHRYRNKNTTEVVEYSRPNARLEYLQNWDKLVDGEPEPEAAPAGNGGLLGQPQVGDTPLEERGATLPAPDADWDVPASQTAPVGPDPKNRPAKGATKEAWVNWAIEGGCSREDAERLTKPELIEIYS